MSKAAYQDFTKRFSLLIKKHPNLITMTLSNIFTMRLIGNKTHGDLAEIAISEFINQYMYDFKSIHVGKDLYRAKSKEEDITVENEITKEKFPISLKAYGDGPLQLSTDKNFLMYPLLEEIGAFINAKEKIEEIFANEAFSCFSEINVLPLIYDEKRQRCNILVFDAARARAETAYIRKETEGSGRKHPAYRFFDKNKNYICEVRYGNAAANALQRGLWTNTKNATSFFDSVTNGWVDYSHNLVLVKLLSHALVSSRKGHEAALEEIKKDILQLKQTNGINV
uniref:SspI n=1 Tax=Sphaerotilus sp. ATCC 13925 TaxID=1231044 RepID=J9T2A8_9BURK|nr:SspI [Sphaerotilus sp. ATCC 13925]